MAEKIAVLGLGYVGLPLAVGLGRVHADIVGFDISQERVRELQAGHDRTDEVDDTTLRAGRVRITHDAGQLNDRTFYIVTVPTPIDDAKRPDLGPIYSACRTVAAALKGRSFVTPPIIVFESTVWPGLTEDICGPELVKLSGLSRSQFRLGYSPERINPGDKEHRLETIKKIVAGEDADTTTRMTAVYGPVIKAGLHQAPNIAVAEAAKVLENTQRDLNIALMNELALICDRLNIRTADVLAAAGTKWNFLRFSPGLVGGHCIGVDPYYLTMRAETLGYHPQVILAGRRINDGMPGFIAEKIIKLLMADGQMGSARIGILGLTFKENIHDIRNSRVPEVMEELRQFGCKLMVHDPMADAAETKHEYNITLSSRDDLKDLDALILAVPHQQFLGEMQHWYAQIRAGGIMADVKSALDPAGIPSDLRYWSL